MNSLEASRVLAVLDETLDGLRSLSLVTSEVLDTAEQLADMLGQDLASALVKHRSLLPYAKSNLGHEGLMSSTWELMRLLKKSPSANRLQLLHTERSPAMLQVLQYFEKLRVFAQKRLTTTVEEDSSNREYYEEVRDREEKAVAEKQQLEQKLKLQRVELQKQMNQIQSSEDKARAELHEVQTSTSRSKQSISSEASGTRAADTDRYSHDFQTLDRELTEAKAQLARLREESKEQEAALRKSKKRAQQDVESVIQEFDADVGSKEDEYQAALAEYNDVIRQLEEYTQGYTAMYTQRMEYEEQQRIKAEEHLRNMLRMVRARRAATVIQQQWRAYKARKVAEAKKKKKAEKAKQKKK